MINKLMKCVFLKIHHETLFKAVFIVQNIKTAQKKILVKQFHVTSDKTFREYTSWQKSYHNTL